MPLLTIASPTDTGLYGTAAKPLVLKNGLASEAASGDTWTLPGSMWVQNQFRIGGSTALFLADTVDGSVQLYGETLLGPYGVTSSGTTTQPSYALFTQYSYWSGTADTPSLGYALQAVPSSAAAGKGDLSFFDAGSTEKLRLVAGNGNLLITGNLDLLAAGTLAIGGTTATGITLGKAGVTVNAPGQLQEAGSRVWTAATLTNLSQLTNGPGYAPLASPTFTGTPAAPTAALNTNTTQIATTAFVLGQASTSNPVMNGAVAVGTGTTWARADHVHPSDTSRAPLASPTFTGTPAGPTAALNTNTTQLATTAFVLGQASTTTPVMNGTAAVGTGTTWARADHVHASDTSRAPTANPTFTGTVTAPTIDTSGTLALGTSSATAVTIGRATMPVTVAGNLSVTGTFNLNSVDRATAGTLSIGTSTATSINIGKAGTTTTFTGTSVDVSNSTLYALIIDTNGAGNMSIGNSCSGQITIGGTNANGITLALDTQLNGSLDVVGGNVNVSGGANLSTAGASFTAWGGGLALIGLGKPAAPTVTPQGTAGTTTYTYYIVAKDAFGNKSQVGTAGSTTTGNATLSSVNKNHLTWAAPPGSVSFDVLKLVTGVIKSIGTSFTASFDDTGQTPVSYSLPNRDGTADATLPGLLNVGWGLQAGVAASNSTLSDPGTPAISAQGTSNGSVSAKNQGLGGYFIGGDCGANNGWYGGDGLRALGGYADAVANSATMGGGNGITATGGDGFTGGDGIYAIGGASQTDTSTIGTGVGGNGITAQGGPADANGGGAGWGGYFTGGVGGGGGIHVRGETLGADMQGGSGYLALIARGNNYKYAIQLTGNAGIQCDTSTNYWGTTAMSHYLGQENIVAAWSLFTTAASANPTVSRSFGVSSVTLNGTLVRVNFAQAMSDTSYRVEYSLQDTTAATLYINSKTTTYVEIGMHDSTWAAHSLGIAGYNIAVAVMGKQT